MHRVDTTILHFTQPECETARRDSISRVNFNFAENVQIMINRNGNHFFDDLCCDPIPSIQSTNPESSQSRLSLLALTFQFSLHSVCLFDCIPDAILWCFAPSKIRHPRLFVKLEMTQLGNACFNQNAERPRDFFNSHPWHETSTF